MRRLGSSRLAGKVHLALPAGKVHFALPAGKDHFALPAGKDHFALPAGKDHFALPAGKDHIVYSERGAMECEAFGIPAGRVEGEVPPIAGRA
jgi:hypothetical protein